MSLHAGARARPLAAFLRGGKVSESIWLKQWWKISRPPPMQKQMASSLLYNPFWVPIRASGACGLYQSRLLYHLAYLQINKSIWCGKTKRAQKKAENQRYQSPCFHFLVWSYLLECFPADRAAFSLVMSKNRNPAEASHSRGSLIKK